MFSFNLLRWLRSWSRVRVKTIERRPRIRLTLETLEDRITPVTYNWTGAGGTANWSNGANWNVGAINPAAPIDLVFGTAGITTTNDLIGLDLNSITFSANNVTLTGNALTLGNPGTAGSGFMTVQPGLNNETISAGLNIQLAGAGSSQQFFTVGSASTLTINSQLSGTTGSQLTKEGNGTLILNGNDNGYIGPFTIDHDAGVVQISNNQALGGVTTSTVETLTLNNPTLSPPSAVTTNFTASYGAGTTTAITYTGNTAVDAAALQAALNLLPTINAGGNSVQVYATSTASAETFSITFTGPTWTGANVALQVTAAVTSGGGLFSAPSTVAGGSVSPYFVTVGNNSQLQLNSILGGSVANTVELFGNGASNNGALQNFAGANIWSGSIVLESSTGNNTDLGILAGSLTVTGVISDAVAPVSLTKLGAGQLILTNANVYRGSTFIENGVLTIQNPLALGAVPSAGTYTENNSVNGDQGSLQLAYTLGAALPTANLQDYLLQNPANPYNAATNPYVGFTVPNYQLYLLGPGYQFPIQFTLENVEGNNAWSGPITLETGGFLVNSINIGVDTFPVLGGTPTTLTLSGVISDLNAATSPSLNKWNAGNLILEPSVVNASTGLPTSQGTANTYKGATTVWQGNITLEDSQGLGLTTKPSATGLTMVDIGAELDLVANVGHLDSVTGTTNRLTVSAPLDIDGSGIAPANLGALRSISGINTYTVTAPNTSPIIKIGLIGTGNASIGVDPEPVETANSSYITNDYSLTINGGLSGTTFGGVTANINKVGAGQLILPNANTAYTGTFDIQTGWVTVQDPESMGLVQPQIQETRPTDTVGSGAALMLQPLVPGTSFNFANNLVLQGMGITHAYAQINEKGAFENLGGVNTVSGNIQLIGQTGIGVEQTDPNIPSDLTLFGENSEKAPAASLTLPTVAASGGVAQYTQIVDTGSTIGSLSIAYAGANSDTIQVYSGPLGTPGSTLLASGIVTGAGLFPVGGLSYLGYGTNLEIVVDNGVVPAGAAWSYAVTVTPNLLAGNVKGGIVKVGSQRLNLEGAGTFTGGVDIQQGVVRVLNNTALGSPIYNLGTTVETGAALELTTIPAAVNGGVTTGANIQGVPLTLYGTGNSTFGDAPLTVLSKDNQWQGPIVLNSNIAITFQGTLANQPVNTIAANYRDALGNLTLQGTSPTVNIATTTAGVAGSISAVQTLTFGGAISSAVSPSNYFTLTYNGSTTGNILWNSDPNLLVANIQAALNAITGFSGNFSIALTSPTINVNPNARLIVSGVVSDGGVGGASPLIHNYVLAGPTSSFNDTLGGPALVPVFAFPSVGPGVLSAAGYTMANFPSNQGLTLSNWVGASPSTDANYSVQIDFDFTQIPPPSGFYDQIINYMTGNDNGIYLNGTTVANTALDAYNGGPNNGQGGLFTPGVPFDLVITRDGTTGQVTGYVNGVQALSFNDSVSQQMIFSNPNNLATFFEDIDSFPDETSGGTVTALKIYNRPLTTSEVLTVSGGGLLGSGNTTAIAPSDLNVAGGGELLLSGANTYRGVTNVQQGTLTIQNNLALGSTGTNGVQELSLIDAVPGSTKFQLYFDPSNGSPVIGKNLTAAAGITYTGTSADAAAIQSALQGLTTIGANNVLVTQQNPGVFLVTYYNSLAGTSTLLSPSIVSGGIAGSTAIVDGVDGGTVVDNQAQLQMEGGISVGGESLIVQGSGSNLESTVQTFTVGSSAAPPTAPSGTYSLKFNGSATVALPYNANAAQVQAALSSLLPAGGAVSVSQIGFSAGVNEVQNFSFPTSFAVGTTFQLYFDPSGGAAVFNYNLTPAIAFTGVPFTDRANIVNALSALQTIGGVSVGGAVAQGTAGTNPTEFVNVSFQGGLADQPLPLVAVSYPGVHAGIITVTHAPTGSTGTRSFKVVFQGTLSGQLEPLMTVAGTTGTTTVTNPAYSIQGGTANATPLGYFSVGPNPISNAQVFNGGLPGFPAQNTAGRITGLGVYNQVQSGSDIYVSTAGGGLWRTVDGGAHWTPLADNLGNNVPLYGGAVAFDQANVTNLYYGTGEGNLSGDSYYGSGVYMNGTLLTDPGLGNPLAGKAINKIIVNPNNTFEIWVAVGDQAVNGTTGNAGIWRYDGVHWLNMTAGTFPSANANYSDLAYDPLAGVNGTLYAALNGTDVLVNVNPAAAAPPAFTNTNISAVVAAGLIGNIKLATNGTTNTIYAAVTNLFTGSVLDILQSVNAGGTWTLLTLPPNYQSTQGWYDSAIVAKGLNIFVAGDDNGGGTNFVLWSPDGGATWNDISQDSGQLGPHTDVHALALDAQGRLIVGSDGGVWRATLNYVTHTVTSWADLNGDLGITELYSVAPQPNSTAILGGAQDNGTFLYNGSQQWGQVFAFDGQKDVYVPTNPTIAYQVTNGAVYQSTDGGALFSSFPIQSGTTVAVDPNNPNRVVVGGPTLFESLNTGTTWVNLAVPITSDLVALGDKQGTYQADPSFTDLTAHAANYNDSGTIYTATTTAALGGVGPDLRVMKDDGQSGQHWSANRSPAALMADGTSISDLVVDPANRDTLFVTTTGFSNVAAGNATKHVFKSTDAGQTWTDISGNLPDLPTWSLVVDPRSNDLYVGTDVGVYKLTGGTGSWQKFGVGLPNVQVHDLQLDTTNNVLTLGTYGRSVWQFYLDDTQQNAGAVRALGGNDVWTGTITLAGPTTISANGSQNLQSGFSGAQLTLRGTISDATATTANTLTKSGGGDVVLQGANTYAGLTDVQQGNLVVQNPNALGSPGMGTTVETGAALELSSNLSLEPVTLNGNGVQPPYNGHFTGALVNVSNANIDTGTILLNTNATIGVQAGQLTLSPAGGGVAIADGGTATTKYGLTKEGIGELVLASSDSYQGGTTITDGILDIQNSNALGVANTATVVAAGAQLRLEQSTANQPTLNAPVAGAGGAISSGTTYYYVLTTVTAAGESIISAEKKITTAAANQEVQLSWNAVSGATGYRLYRSTTAGLYTNALLASLGAGATSYVDTGAAVFAGTPAGLTVANETLYLSGTGLTNDGALRNLSGDNVWTGNVVLSALPNYSPASSPQGVVAINVDANDASTNANNTLTLAGTISEGPSPQAAGLPTPASSASGLADLGAGTLVLAGNNTYTGGTYLGYTFGVTNASGASAPAVPGGIIDVQNSHALGNNAGNAIQRIATYDPPGTSPADTFQLTFNGQTTGALSFGLPASGGFGPTASVQNALNALSSIGAGGVTVTGATVYTGLDEVQTLTLTNPVVGAPATQTKFTLTLGTVSGSISYTGVALTDAAAIQSALQSLPAIGNGNVLVTADATDTIFTITFVGTLSNAPQKLIVPTVTQSAATAAVVETTPADGGPSYIYTVTFNGSAFSSTAQPLITVPVTTSAIFVGVSEVATGGIGTLVYAGSALQLDGDPNHTGQSITLPFNAPAGNAIALNGAGTANSGGALVNVSGKNILQSNIILQSSSTIAADAASQLTITGIVEDPALSVSNPIPTTMPANLTKAGLGTIILAPVAQTITLNDAPVQNSPSLSSGGTLAAGTTYYYVITALSASGESLISNELSVVPTAGKQTASLSWNAVANATGYKVYRTTTTGNYASPALLTTLPSTSTTFLDTGTATALGTPPAVTHFTLSYNNGASGTTANIAYNGTTSAAANIQSALTTLLTSILSSAFNVFVLAVSPTTFVVNFTGAAATNLTPLTGAFVDSGTGAISTRVGNTYTGSTTIAAGDLNIQNAHGLGYNASSVQQVNVSGTSGSFQLTFGANTTAAIQYGSTAAQVQAALNSLPSISAGGGSVTVSQSGSSYFVYFNGGPLANAAQPLLTKVTPLNPGISFINITQPVSGGASITTVASGATLQLQSANPLTYFTEASGKPLTLNGLGFDNTGALENVQGNNAWGAPITLGSTSSFGADSPAGTASNLVISQTISGNFGVNKVGAGVVQFASTTGNSYTGATNVYDGTLQLHDTGTGFALPGTQLTIGDITPTTAVQTVTVPGTLTSFTLTYNNGASAVPTAAISLTGVAATDATAIQNALNAIIGSGNFVTVDPGASAGVFEVAFEGALNGTIPIALTSTAITGSGSISVASTVGTPYRAVSDDILQLLGNAQINPAASVTVYSDGLFNLNDNTQSVSGLSITNGSATTGPGTGPSPGVLTDTGTLTIKDGTLTATGSNSKINLNGGNTLTLQGSAVKLTGAGSVLTLTGNVTAQSDTTGPATITGPGTVALADSSTPSFSVSALSGSNPSDLVVTAPLTTGTLGLLKLGSGRLELSGVNTYTGATTITTGDVQVDAGGSIGAVALNGGSVSGTGTVGALSNSTAPGTPASPAYTVNPGVNATANAPGTLSVNGPLAWTSGNVFNVDLTHASSDKLSVNGNVTLGNALLTGTVSANVAINDTFTILQVTGGNTLSGQLDTLVNGTPTATDGTGTNGYAFINGFTFQIVTTTGVNGSVVLKRIQDTLQSFTLTPSSLSPSVYGQDVSYTVTVALETGAILPLNTQMQFTLDANNAPNTPFTTSVTVTRSATNLNVGTATFDPQSATVGNNFTWALGTHTIDATFNDPSGFVIGQSLTTYNQTVNKGPVTVSFAYNPAIPIYGQQATLPQATVTVTPVTAPVTPGSSKPTGDVTFLLDGTTYLDGGASGVSIDTHTGKYTLTLPTNLSAGAHTIKVVYVGDNNYLANATTAAFGLTVQTDSSSITKLPTSSATTTLGATATFNMQVSAGLAGTTSGTPTGTLSYYDGSVATANLLGTSSALSALGNGTATASFSDANLAIGAHTIVVTYTGDGNYAPSTNFTFPYTVTQAPTATTILSPATGVATTVNIPVAITVAVASAPPISTATFGAPSGQVELWVNAVGTGIDLGPATLNTSGPNQGKAIFTSVYLPVGADTIYAVYAGDPNYLTSSTPVAGTISINVNPALSLSTTTLSATTAQIAYNQTITINGGTRPFASVAISGLNAGSTGLTAANFVANASSGTIVIGGTPTAAGTVSFTASVTDAVGATLTQAYTLTVNPALAFTTTTMPAWTVNKAGYNQVPTVTGGTGSRSFSITSGALPSGLSLNSLTGTVFGTPTAIGSSNFTITATDSVGAATSQFFTLLVNSAVAVSPATLSNWTVNKSGYSQSVSATGGTGGVTFGVSAGTLPNGVTLNTSTGQLSGMPIVPGSFTFTITATDTVNATGAQAYTVVIAPAVSITTASLTNWTVNQFGYSRTVATSGGTGADSFSFTGSLPTGLGLNSSTGAITGTPTATGIFSFTITATDTVGAAGSKFFTVTINPAITVNPPSLANWTVNKSGYNQTVSAQAGTGTGADTFSVSAGALPNGLSLNPVTGAITGTPTVAATYSFTMTATDSVGATGTQSYSLTINPAITVNPSSLTNWTINKSGYSQTITASGGTGADTVALTSGTLPAGLSINAGVLSGTPTAVNTYNFTLTVTDAVGATGSQTYTVVIAPAITLTPATLPNWTVNAPGYNRTIVPSGGTGADTFAVTVGVLPAGLSLDSNAGTITGTPTTAAAYSFTVTATDSVGAVGSHAYFITINPAVSINTLTLPDWTVNKGGYNRTIATTGGTGADTFSVSSGALPTGLTLASASGIVSGTPTVAGTYAFSITATDTVGAINAQNYNVTINPAITLNPTTLANWTINRSGYSQTLSISGGTGSATYTLTSGSLPTGLTLSGAAGTITGTPTSAATFNFTLTSTDAVNATGSRAYTVTIAPALSITTASLNNWTVNQAGYSQTVATSGGTGAKTFSVSGALPNGLNLDPNTGILSGTPSVTGSFSFTVAATDISGSSASKNFTVVINPSVSLSATSLANWTVGQPGYSQNLAGSGGTGTLSYSVSLGSLPNGLLLNSSSGVLSGVPTVANTFNFSVTATDSTGASATQAYSVTINHALLLGPASLPQDSVNVPYSQTLTASGGTGADSFTLSAGSLPNGLTLNSSSGLINGTPTTAGSSNFTVTLTDAVGASTAQAYTITINPALTITTASLANWTVNQTGYSQTIGVSGGTGAKSFSVTGSLPTGMSLDPTSGLLSGTPTVANTFTFSVNATDALNVTVSQSYTVVIHAAPAITTTTLPADTVNVAYSQAVQANGGTGTLVYSSTGTLPTGVTLSSSGLLSGTPTVFGTYNFSVIATDSTGAAATQAYSVVINAAVALPAVSLPAWTANLAGYSQSLAATGGTGTLTYSVSTGMLPAGLGLNSSSGLLSGMPTTAGVASFSITATDSVGAKSVHAYSVTINAALSVNPTALSGADSGVAYSKTITVQGGTRALASVSISSFTDTGTGLNLTTDAVAGTVTLSGTPNTGSVSFTLNVTDAAGATLTQAYTLNVNTAPSFNVTSVPAGTYGATYAQNVSVTNGTLPLSALSITGFSAGTTGLTQAGNFSLDLNGGTVTINGTPTGVGTASFTLNATDGAGVSLSKAYTLTINKAGTSIAVVSSAPTSAVGQSIQLTATVTNTSNSAAVNEGNVTFYADTVGGTPLGTASVSGGTASISTNSLPMGNHTILVVYANANDFNGSDNTASPTAQTVLLASTLTATTPTTSIHYGQTVTFTIGVSGSAGTPTGTVTITEGSTVLAQNTLSGNPATIPGGLTITPLNVGVSNTIVISYSGDGTFAPTSKTVPITVQSAVTTTTLTSNTSITPLETGQAVTYTAVVKGATGGTPETASATMTFKDGTLTLGTGILQSTDATSATYTFTPSGGLAAGSHGITASYSGSNPSSASTEDFAGSTSTPSLSQSVVAGPSLSALSTTQWTVNRAFNKTITFTPSTTGAALVAGSVTFTGLPTGLSLGVSGTTLTLNGIPTTAGVYNSITISANDTHGVTVSKNYTLTINAAPTLTATALPTASYKTLYSTTLTISGGTAPFSLFSSSGLPAGLTASFSTMTGVITISGTPTVVSTVPYNVTFHATDAAGAVLSTSGFTLSVQGAATTTTVTSPSAPWSIGQPITFTAAVTTPGTSAGVPTTGTVTLYVDGVAQPGKTISATGTATFTYTFASGTTLGSHSVYAVYTPPNGTLTFLASTNNPVLTQTVLNPVSVTLQSSATTITSGQSVTFTANLASPAGAPTNSGSVSFFDGTVLLKTIALNGSSTVVFTTSLLSAATHTITAVYSGDGTTYNTAKSNAVSEVVKASRVR